MSLTAGSGPLGEKPAGRFNFTPDPPTGSALLWDPVPYRLRAYLAGECVLDTTDAKLLHETGHLPVYYVPEADLRADLLEPSERTSRCPHKGEASYRSLRVGDRVAQDAVWAYREPLEPAAFLAGHAALYWDRVDEWYVEEEQVFGHPRDPYHRIDVYRTTRPVRATLAGEVLAESVRAKVLYETSHPPRFYLPAEDVRIDLLEPSGARTRCAYKGEASYWHARAGGELHEDVAWTYPDPDDDGRDVRDLVCFDETRVELEVSEQG
ncbi:MAG TPA: DUF427 domain-containing protein [Gaiellaceae bacterium]|nr:DUF427 domain-containing protein [Gaiellaceae bacterium]